MRIVLTGATGFVGAHLARHLHGAGHDLLLISRRVYMASERIRWIQADLGQPEEFAGALAEFAPEAVFHVAWEGIPDFSETMSGKNAMSSIRFLGAAGRLPSVRKIVGVGSCWEYGAVSGPVSENSPAASDNWFTWAKAAVLQSLTRLAQDRSIDWYWPRIFFVYGKGQRPQSLIPSVASALRSGELPDIRSPYATNDFVYVDDIADAMGRCLAEGVPSGIYNLGSARETEVLEVVREIEAILHQGNSASSAIARASSSAFKRGIIADIARSRQHLNWEPRTTLRQGLERYLAGTP